MPTDIRLDKYDKAILRALVRNKDRCLSARELAKKAEVNLKTVDRHIGRLMEFKLVKERKGGNICGKSKS